MSTSSTTVMTPQSLMDYFQLKPKTPCAHTTTTVTNPKRTLESSSHTSKRGKSATPARVFVPFYNVVIQNDTLQISRVLTGQP